MIRVKDKVYITSNNSSLLLDLSTLFIYPNPEYQEKQRLNLSVYNTPIQLKHFRLESNGSAKVLVVPRGGLPKVTKFLKERSIAYRILDERESGYTCDIQLVNTQPEAHQEKIAEMLIKNEGELIEAPPGAGKTIAMLYLVSKLKTSTLILMHEHRLKQQWLQEIHSRLSGSFTLGEIDGEKKDIGDITVAIIHSVYRMIEQDSTFLNKFGVVIIDECHRIPATMYLKVLNNLPSRYRIGVTGTVQRKDGREILLYDVLGEPIYKITESSVNHRVVSFDVKPIYTNISLESPCIVRRGESTLDYTKLLSFLVKNEERNSIILNNIEDSIQQGYFPLVLTDRVSHSKYLYNKLCEKGYKVILLIGETRAKMDWSKIREDNSIQCIVAQSQIASEGLDLPKLSAIHLTCPSSNKPKLKQKIGRIRRYMEGKKTPPLVYDYIDNNVYLVNTSGSTSYVLRSIGLMRLKYYRQLQNEYTL